MAECACDVYMNDRGYYVAECAGCGWVSGELFAEVDAEKAASFHESLPADSQERGGGSDA